MHQSEVTRQQRQLQKKNYFEDLTRQVQAKQGAVHSEIPGVELPEHEQRLGKYQLKHQIENLTAVIPNGTQFIGGALQRDDGFINHQKKLLQQSTMKQHLEAQIAEKHRTQQHLKAQLGLEEQQQRTPPPDERLCHTLQPEPDSVALSSLCQQLIDEKEQLVDKIRQQEEAITSLQLKPPEPVQSAPIKVRPRCKNKNPSLRDKHDAETAKIAAIEQRIENARRKRVEQHRRIRIEAKPAQKTHAKTNANELAPRYNSADTQSTHSPLGNHPRIQGTWGPSDGFPPIISPKKLAPECLDRENLDTAGKSWFIYPKAGTFFGTHQDEIDNFMQEQARKNPSHWTSARSVSDDVLEKSAMTFTACEMRKRVARPVIAKGLPANVFRVRP